MNFVKLVVNADDFGLSTEVNEAVAMSFNKGLISRASLMVNMTGFEEAIKIIQSQKLYSRIGLHLNFSEGIPLTSDIRKLNRFCDEGGKFKNYKYQVNDLIKTFTKEEKEALRKEIIAQFAKCESMGLNVHHIDSHHHQHIEWQINNVLLEVLREKKLVNSIRLAGYSRSKIKNMYRYFLNKKIEKGGYKTEDMLLNIEELNNKNISRGKTIEIMCHPILIDEIIMEDSKFELSSLIMNILQMYRGNCVIL